MAGLPSVYTHQLTDSPPYAPTPHPHSLLAAHGRLVALCAPGAAAIDLFDAGAAAELSAALGPGRCKLRFVASLAVTDIADAVAVHALVFLRGGALAVAGVCARGAGAFFPARWRQDSQG